ncbi:unnamed protein product [Echinostoma caproni]|uniref:Alpha-mannosidase n=1 Tax=Echinostoma caproni TaxID=27848 RepID=A0A183AHD7_9TREM|nr:unnamed protein product [Echinostoma caproni]
MVLWLLCIISLSFLSRLIPIAQQEQHTCAAPACEFGKPDAVNVHILAHSHLDVGWVRTVDQYYYDSVKSILDSVIEQLDSVKHYRFTFAEIAFFHRWWQDQDANIRDRVRELVKRGALEFGLGGWVSADEATVYYADAIDQLRLGRNFIQREFGQCGLPRIAWQLDSFGHARDHANLFLGSGYDAIVFQRVDHEEKKSRAREKSLQLLWDTSVPGGIDNHDHGNRTIPSGTLFTHILSTSYCDYITHDGHTVLNSLEKRVEEYQTNHIAYLMGCDFEFQDAKIQLDMLDRLVQSLNGLSVHGKLINAFFSTPICYTQAVNKAFNNSTMSIPRRAGDFMPLASRRHPLRPLGLQTYHIERVQTSQLTGQKKHAWIKPKSHSTSDWKFVLKSDNYSPWVLLEAINRNGLGRITIRIELLMYVRPQLYGGASGAYIFSSWFEATYVGHPKFLEFKQELFHQITVQYGNWASMDVRLYNDNQIEVEWTIGPMPDNHGTTNRDVIIRYTLEADPPTLNPFTPGEFYTDSAGRRLIRRVRHKRPDWNVTRLDPGSDSLPISGNYYPIVNRILIKGAETPSNSSRSSQMAFAVYPDRAEGGTSLVDGQIELMLHRRILSDDYLGMGETLAENGIDGKGLIVRGKHIIRLAEWSHLCTEDRLMAEYVTRPPLALFAPTTGPVQWDWKMRPWMGLTRSLPHAVHLVSLMRWPQSYNGKPQSSNGLLVLFDYHVTDEHAREPYELSISDLFQQVCVTDAEEVTLTGEQFIADMLNKRLKWPGETLARNHEVVSRNGTKHVRKIDESVLLVLQPGQIQAFVLKYIPHTNCCSI